MWVLVPWGVVMVKQLTDATWVLSLWCFDHQLTRLMTMRMQVGSGSMGIREVQPATRRQCYVWQPPLALELHPGLPHHLSYFHATDAMGNLQESKQVHHFSLSCSPAYC